MLTPRTTTTTLPGGITIVTETRTVDVTLIPFIRSRKVFFRAEGLLPNTRHRPWFDGVDVSAWCREETFQNRDGQNWASADGFNAAALTQHPETSSSLIADANGVIEGSFYIPNTNALKFRTGTREFKLLDYLAADDTNAISAAYANYVARGVLQTDVSTVTTLVPPPAPPPRRRDPVAQSFVVERASGAFITSVDLFFQSKSSTVPLQVQIREMENGLPTSRIVPGAEVFVLPASVNVSNNPDFTNAAHRTRATFRAPVYLEGFVEYALVVLAESVDYNIWTAATTEFVVGSTTQRIMKQPSLGSFFKSQNGSTWTPDQSRDMMFGINRAVFSTSESTAVFENDQLPRVKLETDPIEVLEVGASPDVRVYQPNHGMVVGGTATLSGLTATRGLTTGQLNTGHTVVDVESLDTYIIQPAGTSTTEGRGGGSAAYAKRSLSFSVAFPNINELVLPNTRARWEAQFTSGASPMGDEAAFIKSGTWVPLFENSNMFFSATQMVADDINEAANVGEKSLSVRAILKSDDDFVSPVIDLSRLSLTLVGNRIDNPAAAPADGVNVPAIYVAETDPSEGSAVAKHLTVPVTLTTPAIGLKVLFAANRPADSFIDLYYRTLPTGSGGDITQEAWVLAGIDEATTTDENPDIFREYVYTIPNDGTDLDSFDTYQFKIVFRSRSTAKVPRIRDIRGIALGT